MRFFNGHILFVIFIFLCGSLLLLQQTAELLTDIRYDDDCIIPDEVVGEIYKAPWNRESDFVLCTADYNILIRGTYLSDTKIDKIEKSEYIGLKECLEIPEECSNFGAFDMRKYLASKDIDFAAYPKDSNVIFPDRLCSDTSIHSIQFYSSELRKTIENSLLKVSDRDTASICMSVMTGDGKLLDSDTKSVFQRAGLSHLMAVSGAHVSFIINPIKKLLRLIKCRRMDMRLKNIILIPFVLLIAFVAGFTPSVVRAAVMCIIMILSVIFRRKYDPINALGFVGILSIVLNPYCVFDTGFVLSYCACICLYVVLPSLKKIRCFSSLRCKPITDGLLCGIAVNLGILPIVINMFNGFSVISIIVNIAASLFAEIIYVGTCVIFIAELFFVPITVCHFLFYPITAVVRFLEICASFSSGGLFGYREYPSISVHNIVVYYIILIFAVAYLNNKLNNMFVKSIAITGTSAMLFSFTYFSPKAEFLFFDVGQGSSVMFSSADGYNGLIDSGDGFTDVSQLLKKQGVSKLDFIIISHGHSDHSGGFKDVIENIDCDVVFLPGNDADENVSELESIAMKKDIKVIYVEGSVEVSVGEYTNVMLTCYTDNSNINNSSIISCFYGGWGSVLLPGDIEEKSELCFALEFSRKIDLLCVSHHGSDTSSSDEFLETLSPKYAIISVGKDNMYGHPSPAVVDRVDDFTISGDVYRTDECGAVKFCFGVFFDFDGDDIYVWQKKRTTE